MSSVYLNVRAARDIRAADKGGTSDPYAVAELIDAATGSPLKKQQKKKTKTIKKTLAPAWDDGEVTWNDVAEDLAGVSVRVSVFDADALSSEPLGEALVPLASFVGLSADKDVWVPLADAGKMKEGTASGAVSVTLRVVSAASGRSRPASPKGAAADAVADAAEETSNADATDAAGNGGGSRAQTPALATFKRSRVWVNVRAAKDLHGTSKDGTSDPYAVAELVDARSGKPLKKKTKKLKTKSIKKTNDPSWDDGEFAWHDVEEMVDSVAVRVTVFDANAMSSAALGTVSVPLAAYWAVAGSPEDTQWDKGGGWWLPLAASKFDKASGSQQVQMSVRVQVSAAEGAALDREAKARAKRAALNPAVANAEAAAKAAAAAKKAADEPDLSVVTLRIVGAKDLRAADKGGTSDPFCVIELVDVATGKPLGGKTKKVKTLTCKKTLAPQWDETVVWKDLAEAVGSVGIRVNVFDANGYIIVSSVALGSVTVPLSWGHAHPDKAKAVTRAMRAKGTGPVWYPLAAAGNVGSGPAGQVLLDFRVESTADLRRAKPPPKPFRASTWEDRVRACQKGGKLRLDLARLELGDGGLPKAALSPALGLGLSLKHLNLKGNGLLQLPPFLSAALPLLESLVLSENRLSDLPEDLALLGALSALALDRNDFKALPLVLFSASLAASLTHLNVSGNQLTDIPDAIGSLLQLETLLLADNLLEPDGLPAEELEKMVTDECLAEIDLDGNPCWPADPAGAPSGQAARAPGRWVPPTEVAKLLDARALFRSKGQRQDAMQRGLALKRRLAARAAGAGALVERTSSGLNAD